MADNRLPEDVREQMHAMYSSGLYSNVKLAEQFGVSESVVRKYAKRYGWARDASSTIRAESRAILQREAAQQAAPAGKSITEADVVRVGAGQVAAIERDHRDRAGKLKSMADRLYEGLREQTEQIGKLEDILNRALAQDDLSTQTITEIAAAVSTGTHVKTFKALVEATDKLVTIERKAYAMDKEDGGAGGTLDSFLMALTPAAQSYRPPVAPVLPTAAEAERNAP